MKLFQHYKNKPYKFMGLAKHSETLEDLVIYQCLYDNPQAAVWCRPKDLFFSEVEIQGKRRPRFAKTELTVSGAETLGELDFANINRVAAQAFPEWDSQWFENKLKGHGKVFALTASIDGEPVAFKIGYQKSHEVFYSWLGGVVPQMRGLGIANELMERQHEWCRSQNYKTIQTKTQNEYKSMLLLNIKHDFRVISTVFEEDRLKILMEKTL